jgi:hypothetical protein
VPQRRRQSACRPSIPRGELFANAIASRLARYCGCRAGCHVGITFKRKVWKQPFGGAEASRDRLGLASQAGSLSLALDAADTIQAQDSLEKMLVH